MDFKAALLKNMDTKKKQKKTGGQASAAHTAGPSSHSDIVSCAGPWSWHGITEDY